MKRTVLAAIMVFLILSPIGCGHSSSSPQIFISPLIISDQNFDGDISNALIITTIAQGFQSVLAGIDPSSGTEYRAFLDFSLASVPGNAGIDSAVLDIFINNIAPSTGTIPISIDLIPIQFTQLTQSDYNIPPLATITIPIFQSDFSQHVPIDVTSLMIEAQNRGLTNFRIRILEGSLSPGLIEINDTTGVNRGTLAPALQVTYF